MTISRVSSARIVPPMSLEPRLGMTSGCDDNRDWTKLLLCLRHPWVKTCSCQVSSRFPHSLKVLTNRIRQCKVHVVATEDMVAHRNAAQDELSLLAD